MKLDDEYTHIDVCPQTKEPMSDGEIYYADGVCCKCGHASNSTITHYEQVVGRWNRPSFIERWLKGKKAEFFTKEEEDKVWNTLKN